MEEPDDLGPHMWNHHRAVVVALDTTMVPDDLDLHVTRKHRGITIVPDMEAEVNDLGHHNEHMIIHAKESPKIQSHKNGSIDPATSGMSTIMMTITRSAHPAIMRDIASTVKLLQDIGVAAVIRGSNTKTTTITMIVGMNLDPVNHTDLKHQGSNQSPEDILNGP
jgi:hypothetical protein